MEESSGCVLKILIASRHKSALQGVNGDRSDAFQNCFENKNRNSETLKKKKLLGIRQNEPSHVMSESKHFPFTEGATFGNLTVLTNECSLISLDICAFSSSKILSATKLRGVSVEEVTIWHEMLACTVRWGAGECHNEHSRIFRVICQV